MIALPIPRFFRMLAIACMVFAGLMMIQDLLSARHQGYQYYWSESLLFSSGWLYVLPIALAMGRAAAYIGERFRIARYLMLIGTAVTVHVLIFSFGVYLFSLLALDHTYGFVGNLAYAFSSGLIMYVGIYGVTGCVLFFRPRSVPEVTARKTLEVTNGRNPVFVQTSDIIFVQSADPYLAIHTNAGKFLYRSSLVELNDMLGQSFVRIHRSTLVNLHFLAEMTSRGNGDYDLLLRNGQLLRLSRRYLAGFRQRLSRLHSA